MTDYLAHPLLTLALATLAPTASFAALNLRFYNTRQIFIALTTAGLAGAFFGLPISSLHAHVAAWSMVKFLAASGVSFADFLVGAAGLALFFLFSERFFTKILPDAKKRHMLVAGLILFLSGLSAFFSLLPLNALLLVHLLLSGFDAHREAKRNKEPLFNSDRERRYSGPVIKRGVTLEHKPNIFLLLLESYHSAEAMYRLYGIDDSPLDDFLRQHDFTDYPHTFCNEAGTVRSLQNLLNCSLLTDTRQGAFVLDVLRENGYACEFFDSKFFVFGHLIRPEDYTSFDMPAYVRQLYNLAGPLFSQSRYLRKFVGDFDPFETDMDFPAIQAALRRRLTVEAKHPRLFCLRFGADHMETNTAWLSDASAFHSEYKEWARSGQEQIRQIVGLIVERDPSALVVAVGDHGSLRHQNAWKGPYDAVEVMRERGVSMEELALDMFSVRLAVRWPVPHATDGKILSHVNLFRYILAALRGEKQLPGNLQPDISLLDGGRYIAVRDGAPLARLEAYIMETLWRSEHFFANDRPKPNRVGRSASREKDGLALMKSALRARNNDPHLAVKYMRRLLMFGQYSETLDIFRQAHLEGSLDANMYAARAYWRQGRQKEALRMGGELVRAYPENFQVYVHLGLLLLEQESHTPARDLTARGLARLEKKQGITLLYPLLKLHAVACMTAGDFPSAENALVRLCSFCNGEAWGWLLLSQVQEAQGRVLEALHTLTKAVGYKSGAGCLLAAIGHLALRHDMRETYFQPFKEAALAELQWSQTLVASSGVFDPAWYAARFQEKRDISPLRHYLTLGICQGAEPVPWFSSLPYLLRNADVWNEGINPFMHFLTLGLSQLREPALGRHPMAVLSAHEEVRGDAVRAARLLHQAWAA